VSNVLDQLHDSLDSRLRPEDVAALILTTGEDFTAGQRRMLERAANSRPKWWYSSMSSDFARPVDASRQLATLVRLFDHDAQAYAGTGVAGDPNALRVLAHVAGHPLGWTSGIDFKSRANREARDAAGVELSKRQYNRAWRFLIRLDDKIARLDTELRKRELMLAGRSGIAADITADRFRRDPATACFVAYFVARKNLRREFSLSGKTNPMDEIADMLLNRLGDDSDWWMVSRVHPTPDVVARLSVVEQGELLGRWSSLMRGAADILRQAWDPSTNRTTMIVRRGMDSSTWNTVAQAYNTARAGWMNALAATGALGLLDVACPGKVMRLMAADLAYWHRSSGSDVDPDTAVWAALPLPWEVLSGEASCTRDYVAETCARFEVDAERRGWVGPRATGRVARFEATPELVHGVSIADPVWAALLRRAGVFSGKRITPGYEGLSVPPDVVVSDLPTKTVQEGTL
jgi:hypothetical protein